MFAHLDGNNFYASCERSLNPALRDKPVVVLSNNDGCVVARSQEAKELGIKMGQPYFQVKHLEWTSGLVALSANFPLYGDLSSRMMSLCAPLGCGIEQYSIDEAFLDVTGIPDVRRRALTIRERILRGIGIPCGIGIAPSKTLAKFANHVAKTAERKVGVYPAELARVCDLSALSSGELDALLACTAVGDVWGIGPRLSRQFLELDILTALDLKRLDPASARRRWSLPVERTIRELRGESCIELEDAPPPKQMIATTRSFGQPVTQLRVLEEAVSAFTTKAAQKLRKQGGLAGNIQVFAHTSYFRPGPRYSKSVTISLSRPTADTQVLVAAALKGARLVFHPDFDLAKAGIILLDLVDGAMAQQELALEEPVKDRSALLTAVDQLNSKYGQGTVQLAAAGAPRTRAGWGMKQDRRSPYYTTVLQDIPTVRC